MACFPQQDENNPSVNTVRELYSQNRNKIKQDTGQCLTSLIHAGDIPRPFSGQASKLPT